MAKVAKMALSPVGTLLGLFNGPKPPKQPKPMPMPDQDAVKRSAMKNTLTEQGKRGGRSSTILTSSEAVSPLATTLGGG